tara:strand:+ start:501 stop:971 length:471 start_codon:yes stop_codon:yes gene_type:complete
MIPVACVFRDRQFDHARAGVGKTQRLLTDDAVDVRLRYRGAEALRDESDAQALRVPRQRPGIGFYLEARVLPRITAIIEAGEHFEQQRTVGDAGGHRPEMVDPRIDRERTGIRHEPVRRLDPVTARKRTRHPDRTALIAADGHVAFAGDDERGTAA